MVTTEPRYRYMTLMALNMLNKQNLLNIFNLQENEPRLYEDIQDFEASKALFQEILEEYNESHTPMNLVLFEDALGESVIVFITVFTQFHSE